MLILIHWGIVRCARSGYLREDRYRVGRPRVREVKVRITRGVPRTLSHATSAVSDPADKAQQ